MQKDEAWKQPGHKVARSCAFVKCLKEFLDHCLFGIHCTAPFVSANTADRCKIVIIL